MTARIVSFRPVDRVSDEFSDADVTEYPRERYSTAEVGDLIGDAEGLYVSSENDYSAPVLESATSLDVIGKPGSGIDNIDVGAATERGITVVHMPGGNSEAVAEFTVALTLDWLRKIPQAIQFARDGGWRWDTQQWEGPDLKGKTVGIIGLGACGLETGKRLSGFDVDLLANDPYIPQERAKLVDAELVGLDELLAASDIVVVHARLTDETHSLLGADEFDRMKESAPLVNTARGDIVDEEGLIEAIQDGRIAGAALDVFHDEPPDPDSPLFEMDNVITTPHVAGMGHETRERLSRVTAESVIKVLRGEPVDSTYVANPETLH